MKRLSAFTLLLVATLALCAAAFATGEDTPAGAAAIGSTVADFKLPDADGKERTLASLAGAKGTVLIFVSTQCPVSNAYNERMEKLAQEMKARGVNVVGINSNVAETPADIKSHAAGNNLSFAILKDAGNRIADRLGASVTPEAFLLDASNRLAYRGRIDNSRNGDAITSSELREAIDAILAGKPVAKTEVRAFGCSIKRAS
jgi:peroxiredoxin